jgi:hypothetical protein
MDRIKKSFESTKAPEVQALPSNRTEQTIDNLTNANLETISKALADKDKAIAELQQKIADLKSELDCNCDDDCKTCYLFLSHNCLELNCNCNCRGHDDE